MYFNLGWFFVFCDTRLCCRKSFSFINYVANCHMHTVYLIFNIRIFVSMTYNFCTDNLYIRKIIINWKIGNKAYVLNQLNYTFP